MPGGRYPLPSTALMLAIPAKVAGVKRIAACSPPSKTNGGIHPAVLAAMDIAGVDEIYQVGGAQAVAAFTYGTESIQKVDMIVGPGNRFVTEAKRQVLGEVGIDSLAGPSEVLIIADETADPDFTAIDLLAQCEHDPNARATLVTTSRELAEKTNVVMDGRDIGTVVLPDAELKIFLTASVETRASRRYKELTERGDSCNIEEIEKNISMRDEQDMHREIAPLTQAEDAVYLDSSHMSIEEVTEKILSLYRGKSP